MTRLLKIPTRAMQNIALEERREPDDDIIPMNDAPVEQPVVDDGVGSAGAAAQAENADALAATTSPEAPAAAEADPAADAAADSSVTDAPSAPAAGEETPPPAAGDTAAAAESDVTDPAVGAADTVNNPADEPAVTDTPAVDPDPTTVAAPAGEEQTQAVVNETSDAVDALPDSPVDAGAEPVEPAATATSDATGLPDDVAPAADTTDLGDAASDATPVEGEAPVTPEGSDMTSAASGVDTATDISASTVPDAASAEPAADVATPADATTDAGEPATAEPADPMANVEPEELTSAWVDGVAVDAEEVKQQLEDAGNDVVDADNVTEELEDAAVALEELAAKVSENLAEDNPVVSDTSVNLVRITAEKSLHHIGEVLNLPASLESAATPHQRMMVTLESIGEKAKQIWEAIKKALIAAWNAVVNFFKTLFDSALRVKQAISKLRGAVKTLQDGDSPNNPTVTNAAAVKGIAFDGMKTFADLKAELTKFDGAVGPFLENSKGAIHNAIVAAGNEMVELAEATESNTYTDVVQRPVVQAILMFGEIGQKLAASASTKGETKKGGDGVTVTRSGELPGGYVVQAMVPNFNDPSMKARENAQELIAEILKGDFVSVQHSVKDSAKSAPVLMENEMLELLDLIEGTVDSVLDSKSTVSKFESDIAAFQRQAHDKLIRVDDNLIDRLITRGMINALAQLGPSLIKMNSQLMNLVVSVANNVVRYVTASCREYPSFGSAPKGSATQTGSDNNIAKGTAVAVA